jgi:two-component system response regulator FixJ
MENGLDAAAHTVFLVDDDEAVRDSIRTLLESCGFRVRDYASGPDFLADPDGAGPGCLITDMHMPGMNGLELIGAMQVRARRLPVIVITARADARLFARLRDAGASAVFEKPLDEESLLRAIEQVVGHAADALHSFP